MDIAISGSSGFIGSALTSALVAAGHRPIALVRRAPKAGADEIRFEPVAGIADTASMEGLHAVVNLAGAGIGDARWTDKYRGLLVSSRIGTTTLLASSIAGLQRPPATFLSGSAIGFYGPQGATTLTEESPAGSDFLAQLCVDWEAAASPAVDAGIRTVFLRTGIVLDPAGGALAKMLPLFKMGVGGRFGSGQQYMSWITLEDQIKAMIDLLGSASTVNGPVNLTAPNPVTNTEFTKALSRTVKKPALVPVPSFGPRLLLGGDRAQALLFDSIRVLPDVLGSNGYDFTSSTIDEGLARCLNESFPSAVK